MHVPTLVFNFNFSSPISVSGVVYAKYKDTGSKFRILSWCLEGITTIINRFLSQINCNRGNQTLLHKEGLHEQIKQQYTILWKKNIFFNICHAIIFNHNHQQKKRALYKVPNQLRTSSNIHDKLNKSTFKFQ